MLSIDKCRHTAQALCLGNDVQGESGLARRFRSKDFYNSPSRNAPDSQSMIQTK